MTTIFIAKDDQEARRLAKAEDMALFIWQLIHNEAIRVQEGEGDISDVIQELTNRYSIDIEDLID